MKSKFNPTHTLAVTIGSREGFSAVACLNSDWEPCELGPGVLLVTRTEFEETGEVSYTLDNMERLCLHGNPYFVNSNWVIEKITNAAIIGDEDGHRDQAYEDGCFLNEDGTPKVAPPRIGILWANEGLAEDYLRYYNAARGRTFKEQD